jgi:hypothetical protein
MKQKILHAEQTEKNARLGLRVSMEFREQIDLHYVLRGMSLQELCVTAVEYYLQKTPTIRKP